MAKHLRCCKCCVSRGTVSEMKRKWFARKIEAKACIAQAKRSMMTTGGVQEEVAFSQVDLRIQETERWH